MPIHCIKALLECGPVRIKALPDVRHVGQPAKLASVLIRYEQQLGLKLRDVSSDRSDPCQSRHLEVRIALLHP